MTCVIAAHTKDEKVIIVSDSSCNFAGLKIPTVTEKTIKLPYFLMGFSGDFVGAMILAEIKESSQFKTSKIRSERDCIPLRKYIYDSLKDHFELVTTEKPDLPEFIIAAESGIYILDGLSITRYDDYMAIGSGSELALGALFASTSITEKSVVKAVSAACFYSDSCAEPIIIKEL